MILSIPPKKIKKTVEEKYIKVSQKFLDAIEEFLEHKQLDLFFESDYFDYDNSEKEKKLEKEEKEFIKMFSEGL